MPTLNADTTWIPFRHRATFQRVGVHGVIILLNLVQPRTIVEANETRESIRRLRFVPYQWLVFDRADAFTRAAIRARIEGWGYPLTPWTNPSIHDAGDVLEILLRRFPSPYLVDVMGENLDSWVEGPGPQPRHSDSSSEE